MKRNGSDEADAQEQALSREVTVKQIPKRWPKSNRKGTPQTQGQWNTLPSTQKVECVNLQLANAPGK